ncbi:MAG: HD domain-containing protein [bacterium]|nr:HD domain-containing protein [bacterium]
MLEKVRALLKESENREVFFRRIASFLPPMDPRYRMIEKAYNYAKDAFRDMPPRETGERYFEHLRAVVLIQFDYLRLRNPILLTSGLLHDMTEDIPSWPIERVRLEFGDEVALLQDYLSKPSKEEYPLNEERLAVYHRRFESAPREFFLVKLPDRLHNLLTMWSLSPEKIASKIAETERYYLPHAEKYTILIHELEEALTELKRTKVL